MRGKYDGWGVGGIATQHRWENNTTSGARGDRHAPSMGEKYDGWGVADSPRTIDGRIKRRVGRGGIAMHHRRENNRTGGARPTSNATSTREKQDEWSVGEMPRTTTK